MALLPRKTDPHMLAVGMASVKMGNQIAQIGCADGGRLGAIAAKVGLSGRAAGFMPDEASAARARKGATSQGVLVDVELSPPSRLPSDDDVFDIVIIDDSAGFFSSMTADERAGTVREALRILKPGARVMVIGAAPIGGLAALVKRPQGDPNFDAKPALEADGFKFVRTLGEREGLRFVEGLKPRSG